MYDHRLHRGRKHFCRYSLQAFSPKKVLKCHMNDCFKINGKQKIKMPDKGEYQKQIYKTCCLQYGYQLVCFG